MLNAEVKAEGEKGEDKAEVGNSQLRNYLPPLPF
jgi:hypothetical protein